MGLVEQKLGELLKLERERRRRTLQELSAETKIPEENLQGIESGDLSLLPSEIYYNLFTRTYCQVLGIDYARTLEAIKDELAQDQRRKDKSKLSPKIDDESPGPETADFPFRLNTPSKKIAAALGFLLVIFLVYIGIDKLFLADSLKRNSFTELLKGVDAERLNALAGFNWQVPDYHPPAELNIKLKPRDESWCTVVADGDTVLIRLLVPGREYTVTGKYRLIVSIGVPNAVDVELDGHLVNLRDPLNGRISRIEITQANLESFLNPSLEDLPKSDTSAIQQGNAEPDASAGVKIAEDKHASKDSLTAALDNR